MINSQFYTIEENLFHFDCLFHFIFRNCTKIGLAGGAVYWSYQQGVWGTPDEGFVAMKRLSDAIVPPSQELVERVVKVSKLFFNLSGLES